MRGTVQRRLMGRVIYSMGVSLDGCNAQGEIGRTRAGITRTLIALQGSQHPANQPSGYRVHTMRTRCELPPRTTHTSCQFSNGSFKVAHTGPTTQSLNPKTCLLTVTGHGIYKISGGTGAYAGISGSGKYTLSILAIVPKSGGKCSTTMPPTTARLPSERGKQAERGDDGGHPGECHGLPGRGNQRDHAEQDRADALEGHQTGGQETERLA